MPIPGTFISAAGAVVVDAPRMFVVVAPSVVEPLWENGGDELPSDAVAVGDDSWNEQRARTMPKAAMSAIKKIRLPMTISRSRL
jgi:hypothetical protein